MVALHAVLHLLILGTGFADDGNYPGLSSETSNSFVCSTSSRWPGETDDEYDVPDTCGAKMTGRRLAAPMDVEQLMVTLQDLEMQRWKFPGMIYLARTIDFNYFLGETPFKIFVPILEQITMLASPVYHHLLLFPLGSNGTIADPAQRGLKMMFAEESWELPMYLLIHLQRDGVQGRIVKLPQTEEQHSFRYVGDIDPSWMAATLSAVGKMPFSTISWNCHHFAVRFFENMSHACKASSTPKCPPANVNAAFPTVISPAWCLPCQAFGLTGLSIVLAVLMVGALRKLLKLLKGAEHDGGPAK